MKGVCRRFLNLLASTAGESEERTPAKGRSSCKAHIHHGNAEAIYRTDVCTWHGSFRGGKTDEPAGEDSHKGYHQSGEIRISDRIKAQH